jgi:maltose/moltooligosaccharide transporter
VTGPPGGPRPDPDPPGYRFSYWRVLGIAAGYLGAVMAFTAYNAFLPLFYAEFIDRRVLIGALMGTDNLVGLLLIPVVGAWSDRHVSRWGRRLPFVLAALPVAALAFGGLPWATVSLATLIAADVVFSVAIHAYRGPVVALMPDHTPSEKRSTAHGIMNLMAGIGAVIALGLLAWLFDVDPRLSFGVGAAVLLATLPVVVASAVRHPPFVDDLQGDARPVGDAVDGMRDLLRPHRRAHLLLILSMGVSYLGFAGIDTMFPLYGVNELGLTGGRAAMLVLAFAGSYVVLAIPAGLLGSRYGKVPMMRVGMVLVGVLLLVAALVRSPAALAGLFVVAGFGWALINTNAVPLVADLGGRSSIGFFIGLYYLFTMAGQMLGPTLIGAVMDLVGDVGLFPASAAAFAVSSALLVAGWRRLPAEPTRLAAEAGPTDDLGVERA